MKNFSARHWGLIAVSALFLTACDNAEDRARTHFEKGTNLAASGEIDKAMLEFRNALKLDSEAVEPRLAYAKLLVIRQDFNGAAQNYQVVVERHPENIEARRSLGQLLLLGNELDTARIHIDAAFRLAPEQVDVRALKANLDFRDDKVDEAVQQANSILKDLPGHATASLIIASHALLTDDFKGALAAVDSAIDVSPNEMNLHVSRLDVLTQQGDELGIGDQLKVMRGLDPSNMQVSRSLVRWHVSRNEFADGLNILRDVSRAAPQNVEMAMDVVRFLKTYEGDEAARTELATLVTSRPAQRAQYVMAQVALDREDGLLTDAVSRLSDLVASGVEGDDLLEAQVQLAQIYRAQGKAEDSAALVQEILTNDSRNVEALMLRSAEQLANDEPEQAISTLRNALDVSRKTLMF